MCKEKVLLFMQFEFYLASVCSRVSLRVESIFKIQDPNENSEIDLIQLCKLAI